VQNKVLKEWHWSCLAVLKLLRTDAKFMLCSDCCVIYVYFDELYAQSFIFQQLELGRTHLYSGGQVSISGTCPENYQFFHLFTLILLSGVFQVWLLLQMEHRAKKKPWSTAVCCQRCPLLQAWMLDCFCQFEEKKIRNKSHVSFFIAACVFIYTVMHLLSWFYLS
jgi:hypothetical protein